MGREGKARQSQGPPAIGKRVRVTWDDGGKFKGMVLETNEAARTCTVLYDDGDVFWEENYSDADNFELVHEPIVERARVDALLAALQRAVEEGGRDAGKHPEVIKLHKAALQVAKRRRRTPAAAAAAAEAPGAPTVGKRVLIKFTDGKFYSGIVLDYNATTKKSTVAFDDLEIAWDEEFADPSEYKVQPGPSVDQAHLQPLLAALQKAKAEGKESPGELPAIKKLHKVLLAYEKQHRQQAPGPSKPKAAAAKEPEPEAAATKPKWQPSVKSERQLQMEQRQQAKEREEERRRAAQQKQQAQARRKQSEQEQQAGRARQPPQRLSPTAAAAAQQQAAAQAGKRVRPGSKAAAQGTTKGRTADAKEAEAQPTAAKRQRTYQGAAASAFGSAAVQQHAPKAEAEPSSPRQDGRPERRASQNAKQWLSKTLTSSASELDAMAVHAAADASRQAAAKPLHRGTSGSAEGERATASAEAGGEAAYAIDVGDAADADAGGSKQRAGKRKASEEAEAGGAGAAAGGVAKKRAQVRGKLVDRAGKETRVNLSDYAPGDQTGHYSKLFDEHGVQLTTSCHHCQHQHVRWLCHNLGDAARRKFERPDGFVDATHGNEKLQHPSYCKTCIKTYYPDKSFSSLQACCPRCSGWCNCRECLRKCAFEPPQRTPEERAACARYVLACGGKYVKGQLDQQDEEAAHDGLKLEEVEVDELLELQRVLCNMCATCIVDLHRNCPSCKWDMCDACCKDMRKQQGLPQGAPLLCPNVHCHEDAAAAAAEEEAEAAAAAAEAAAGAAAAEAPGHEADDAQEPAVTQRQRRRTRHDEDEEAAAAPAAANGTEQPDQQHDQQAAGAQWGRDAPASNFKHTFLFRALSDKQQPQPQPAATAAPGLQNGVAQPQAAGAKETDAQPAQDPQQPSSAAGPAAPAAPTNNGVPQAMEVDVQPMANGSEHSNEQQIGVSSALMPAAEATQAVKSEQVAEQQQQQQQQQQQHQGVVEGKDQSMQEQAQASQEVVQLGHVVPQAQQGAEEYVRPKLALGRFRSRETLATMRRIAQEYADADPASYIPFPAPITSQPTAGAAAQAAAAAAAPACSQEPAVDTSNADGAPTSNGNAAATSNGNPGRDAVVGAAAAAAVDAGNGRGAGTSSTTGASTSGSNGSIKWWHDLPREWRRKASSRGQQDYLYTPHVSDLEESGDKGELARRLFCERWRAGEPIIVRGVEPTMSWDPQTMLRATRDQKHNKNEEFAVIDCADGRVFSGNMDAFFKGYREGRQSESMQKDGSSTSNEALLKLKDWPPGADFKERLGRHFQDFLEMLPMPLYTLPQLDAAAAPLNLAAALHEEDNPTDLGPKTYVAYGRIEEVDSEGDSVTKMHQDMTDAVNILLHAQYGAHEAARVARCGDEEASTPMYDGAGAVWGITRRADVAQLRTYLSSHASEFTHLGAPVDMETTGDVVFDQKFMLNTKHRAALKAEHNVELWHFEQHVGEAVFIPGGCPHQVRNLRSCIKVAVDFVSPESLGEALDMAQRLRRADMAQPDTRLRCAPESEERQYQEKLQSSLILMRGVLTAWDVLHGNAAAEEAQRAAPGSSREANGRKGRAGSSAEAGRSSKKARAS